MPTSHLHQLNEIVEAIMLINPQSILDVGVGFGKYGVLVREFLELHDGREQYHTWQRRIDGIEAFADYLTPLHEFIYDTVYVGDALTLLPTLPETYDLILLIDVLEHFPRDIGETLVQNCLQRGHNLLISTPGWFIPQEAAFANPYERHHSLWTRTDFRPWTPHCFVPNDISLICVIGPGSQAVRQEMFTPRRRLKRNFGFLRHLYGALKIRRCVVL